MNCVKCACELAAGAKFCPQCGAAQPAAPAATVPSTCSSCGAGLAPEARFCGGCGQTVGADAPATKSGRVPGSGSLGGATRAVGTTSPESTGGLVDTYRRSFEQASREAEPTPEALAEYERVFAKRSDDGVIDAGEALYLQQERRRLGIPNHHHARLMEGVFDGLPAELRFDIGRAHFVVGERAQVMLEVRPGSAQLIDSFQVWYRTTILDRALADYSSRGLGPNPCEFSLTLEPPKVAGQHKLEGLLLVEFFSGKKFRAHFELPPLKFDPLAGAGAPQQVTYNVTNDWGKTTAANVSNNVGGTANAGARSFGAVQAEVGEWRSLQLKPSSEADAARWLERNGGKAPPATTKPPAGMPLPCRGLYLNAWRGRERPREFWWLRDDEVIFGRFHDPNTNADLELVAEPRSDRQNEEHNAYLSRLHLAVRKTDHGVVVVGLSKGQRPCMLHARPLTGPSEVMSNGSVIVTPTLTIDLDSWCNAEGKAEIVQVRRRGNVEQREYLLAGGGVGVWPERTEYLGKRLENGAQAPIELVWHERSPIVRNVSQAGLTCDGGPVTVGEARFLKAGQIWTVGAFNLEVTDEVVREKA